MLPVFNRETVMPELLESAQERKTFGDYVVLKQIGQGSLGTVFLAEHRFLKRQCVLKVLPLELSQDRAFIQRFQEEVAFLASLDHPNIVKIHNISFAEGHYFLVTDCIVDDLGETTNLAQYLRSRGSPLDEEEIFNILEQLSRALDYAHSKELAHRGIKLNNILISREESKVRVHLSDFGLSRLIGAGAVLSRTYKMVAEMLTVGDLTDQDPQKQASLHASFLQNFNFLAPEQKIVGASHAVGAKADVYAFGVLAYLLLTGKFPEGVFEMPSEVRGDLTLNWDPLIRAALQQNPEKRPITVEPFLSNSQHLEHTSTELRPVIRSAEIKRPETDHDPSAAFQIDTTVKAYRPEKREALEVKPLLTEMVVVHGGTFHRGSNDGNRDEWPRHQVHLSSFALDIHPVTNEQFVRFIEAMGGRRITTTTTLSDLKTLESSDLRVGSASSRDMRSTRWWG